MNQWTDAEIRLTRYAWYLHDLDQIDKSQRTMRVNIFVCVGLVLATATLLVFT
jgi:hypothetical protein